MSDREEKFNYTYSAPTERERREIEDIRRQYAQEDACADKLQRLRRLNARVRNTAMCVALSLGVAGVLLFGLGMSLTLVWEQFAAGIVLSAVGIVPMFLANPVYNFVLKKSRAKNAKETRGLSEESRPGKTKARKMFLAGGARRSCGAPPLRSVRARHGSAARILPLLSYGRRIFTILLQNNYRAAMIFYQNRKNRLV